VSNSPGPVPFLPHSLMYLPSLVNLTMRLLVLPPWPSGDQDIRGRVEGVLGGAGDAGLAQGHQKLAVLIELHDGVALAVVHVAPVGHPNVVIGVDKHAVGVVDHSAAEALHHLAGRIEFHDRVELRLRAIGRSFAAIEHPDALAVAVDGDAYGGAPFAAIGQLGPAVFELVGIGRIIGAVALGVAPFRRQRERRNDRDAERAGHRSCMPHDVSSVVLDRFRPI